VAAIQAVPKKRLGVPRPSRCGAIRFWEDAGHVRRLDCGNYDSCLNAAEALDWEGFTCNGCRAYSPITDEQRLRDAASLLELFNVVRRTK